MKYKNQLFQLIILLIIFGSSCSSQSNTGEINEIITPASTEPSVATEPPVPSDTPKPKVECPQDEVDAYIDEVNMTVEEWDDTILRANSTSRMGLSPVIGELQDIKRSMRRIERPECANYINDIYIVAMDQDIDSFLSFLSQDSDSVVLRKMQGAEKAWKIVEAEFQNFIDSPIEAYEAFNMTQEEILGSLEAPEVFTLPEGWIDRDFPNSDLIISFPNDWTSQNYGENNEFLKISNSDRSVTIRSGSVGESFSEIESDSGRLFSLQTFLETSDYAFYNERSANIEVHSLNKSYVVEYSVRKDSGDNIEDEILAYVVTPDEQNIMFIINTTRDEFAQIDLLLVREIFGSVRIK